MVTLKGNHHPISISNDKFISGTRDIGSPKNISEHNWDNSMTVFPFIQTPPSAQDIEMKLPLQPLLPLHRHYIENGIDAIQNSTTNSRHGRFHAYVLMHNTGFLCCIQIDQLCDAVKNFIH